MRSVSRLFHAAAAYGFIVLPPMYFLESRIARDHPPAITHPEFFYGFVGVALAFQAVFVIIAKEPSKYRLFMLPSALEKFSYAGAAFALVACGRAEPLLLVPATIDAAFGLSFVWAYFRTARS